MNEEQRVQAWLDTLSPEQRVRAQFYLAMPPEMALARIGVRVEEGVALMNNHIANHPQPAGVSTKQLAAVMGGVGAAVGAAATMFKDIWSPN